jgi:hypothetical protein
MWLKIRVLPAIESNGMFHFRLHFWIHCDTNGGTDFSCPSVGIPTEGQEKIRTHP